MHVLGITSESVMIALHVLAAIAFMAVSYVVIRLNVPEKHRLAAVVILAIPPMIPASFNWIGYDSVTLLLLAVLVLAFRVPLIVGFVGVLIGMQHFEIGFVALICWGLASFGVDDGHPVRKRSSIVLGLIGMIGGRLFVVGVALSQGVPPENERYSAAARLYRRAFVTFISAPGLLLWSLFGVLWIVVIAGYAKSTWTRRWSTSAVVLLIAVATTILDSTRVGVVTASLLVFGLLVLNVKHLEVFSSPRFIAAILLVFVLVPRIWLWEGVNQTPCTASNVWNVVDTFVDNDNLIAADCRLYWLDSR